MRQLTPLLLLVGLAACALGDGTGPDATMISVRVRDDRGLNAGRHQVMVTFPASTRLETQTQDDGTVRLRVEDPGVYRIWVIPRDGYVPTDSLRRDVTVAVNEHVVVDFTLHRAGTNGECPCRD